MLCPYLNTISSATISSTTLTFYPMKTSGMGDRTSPLASIYLSRPLPPVIKGGVMVWNDAGTLLPRKFGFSDNQLYER